MKVLKTLGYLLAFAAAVALVMIGQRSRGPGWLLLMFIGLAGLLFLLWLYNRQYTRAERLERKKRGRKGEAHGK